MTYDFKDKVFLLTGAGSGIGCGNPPPHHIALYHRLHVSNAP